MSGKGKARGLKGNAAELLFEKWLIWEGYKAGLTPGPAGRYHRAGMIGGGGFTTRHDIFGAWDFEILRGTAMLPWFVNVTTLNACPAHRKKILSAPWPEPARLSLIHHERTPTPMDRGKSMSYWVVEEYETRQGETRLCGKEAILFDEAMTSKIRVKPSATITVETMEEAGG